MNEFIHQNQLDHARLFSDRFEFIKMIPNNASILEIGVLAGDYSYQLAVANRFSTIELLDTFDTNDWFQPAAERFTAETHFEYIQEKFSVFRNIEFHKGDMRKILPNMSKTFDYIYIDADPRLEGARYSLREAVKLLKPEGIIGINDYVNFTMPNLTFGVVEAVNEFLSIRTHWEVMGFALNRNLFSDIYMRQRM